MFKNVYPRCHFLRFNISLWLRGTRPDFSSEGDRFSEELLNAASGSCNCGSREFSSSRLLLFFGGFFGGVD